MRAELLASPHSPHRSLQFCTLLLAALCCAATVFAADPLETGFKSPPASAKPHTWWHWMNGNVTREGITADLEAMKRVGIGGAQIFNVSEGIPAGPAKFLSPEWRDLMKFAAQEANRLGLELCLHNCAGWSSSGGPWNTPEHAMQHVVTSEVSVKGPAHYSASLPQPPTRLDFYRDIAVLAFRTPDGEGVSMRAFAPKVTASSGDIDGARLIDGRPGTFVTLPAPEANRSQYVQLEFSQPFNSSTVVLSPGTNMGEMKGVLQVSDDGRNFRDVRAIEIPRRPPRSIGFTLGSGPVSAKFYRITFTSAPTGVTEFSLPDVDLSPQLRIENIGAKDGDNGGFVLSSPATAEVAPSLVVKRDEIVDLTGKLGANGHLDWDVPAGTWTILRLGYTPTGRNNHPAPPEATGLECDKFSKEAFDAHWAGFVQKVLDDLGPLAGKGKALNNVLIDSYEVGGQNWSAAFRQEFKKRRGYDPLRFLPTFTGRVVDNPEISERFLWDVRRTIADLFAENYYGHFAELCRKRGLLASIEPYTGPFESLQSGEPADITMGEFWVGDAPHRSVKLAASVGHIYGQPVIGAESFTARPGARHGRWLDDPYSLKGIGDLIFCQGINRYIFHRFAMQPWTNRWPGMTMGQWGTHFDRTSTWWSQGRAWLEYVARCQFLLQQGHFVADVAYFCGESTPVEMRVDTGDFARPEGYDFDAINADVLLHRARVRNGRLVLDSGVSYRVLVLPTADRNVRPGLLRRLRGFVADGLTIVGLPPATSPSLEDYPRCDTEVRKLSSEMWGDLKDTSVMEHKLGKGNVTWNKLGDVLAGLETGPDFTFATSGDSQLAFIHRSTRDAEIYFVSNQRDRADLVECSFRVGGKLPELWNAETGDIEPAPVWREEGGRTIVPLSFDPVGSMFVVFRSKAPADHLVALRQTGVTAVGTPAGASDLRILKAVYGVLPQAVDVTSAVKSLLATGTRRIPASNEFAGDDPAPDVVKILHLEYILNGKNLTNEIAEGRDLELPAGADAVKATYGYFPGRRSAPLDVTAKVQSLVAGGARQIPASNDMAGDDPAPNVGKRLDVTFRRNGERWTVHAPEGESVEVPPNAEVENALYGDPGGGAPAREPVVDVTAKLAGLVRNGQLSVLVDNDLAGEDPEYGTPKELRVDYTLNGAVRSAAAPEGATLSLPDTPATAALPASTVVLRGDPSGHVKLLSAGPGTFALTWASGRTNEVMLGSVAPPIQVSGDWQVSFPPNWGAPARLTLDKLISWTDHPDTGVRYFSGTATYEKEVEIPAEFLRAGREVWLDLGKVKNLAEVSLNGRSLGILWKPPFRAQLTGAAQPGRNRLEVKVTNLWPNRLIGDEQLPDDREWQGKRLAAWPQWVLDGKPSPTGRLTFTTWHHWTKTDALLESGLLGPVAISVIEPVLIQASANQN